MSEPGNGEHELGFDDLLTRLGASGADGGADAELAREFRRVLGKTPYPAVLRVVRREFHGTDGATLKALAERAFAAARKSREDRRWRECVRHLCLALASYPLAGDLEGAATSLGNLGAGFAELHYYKDAIVLQRVALLYKARFQRDPANVVRSLFLIAQASYKLGNYGDAIMYLQRAGELRPANHERSDLERKAKNALDLLRQWRGALNNPPDKAVADCVADAERCEEEGESPAALVAYGRAAGHARLHEDAAIEARALLGAARLFYSRFSMHAEAAAQAAVAAVLARKVSAAEELVHAYQIQGLALMECGEFSTATSAFEAGLAALPREPPSRLEVELGIGLAFTLFCSGSMEEATRQLEHTLESASRVDADEAVQVWYLRSGQLFRAADYLEAAVRVLRAAVERFGKAGIEGRRVADIYSELAQCYFVSDRANAAVLALDQAITFSEQAGDEESVGRNYVHLACAYLDMQNIELAVIALRQAEPHVKACHDSSLDSYFRSVSMDAVNRQLKNALRAKTLSSGGTPIVGAEEQASAMHLLKAKIAEAERGQSAISQEELASLYSELGAELDRARKFDESQQAFRSALRIAGLGKIRGSILQNYAVCLARSGDIEAARSVFEAALASKDQFAEGADRLSSLVSLARVNLALHRPADYFSLAQQIETESGHAPVGQRALYLAQVAELYEGSGYIAEARTAISGAVDLLRAQAETDDSDTLVSALTYAARIELEQDNLARAEELGHEALDTLEAQRVYTRTSTHPHWQAQTLAATRVLIDMLYRSGQPRATDALRILETAKTRSMLRRYGLWLVQQPTDFPAELRNKEDYILTMLRYHDYFGDTADPVASDLMRTTESDTYAQAQEFWDSLPEPWQAYGALRQGKPVDHLGLIRGIRSSDRVHFIILFPADTQTLVWHLTPDGTMAAWTSIPVNHDAVTTIGQQTLSAAARLEPLPDAWHELSRELTRPWLRDVPEGATVCFVPSRSTMELPFSLLESGDGYLSERNPITCLPALSLLAYWAESRPRRTISNPVVLGDSLNDLRNARIEAQSVARRLGTQAFLGPEVIRALISRPLEHCDLLHVSGHARFDHRSAERSGFVLADSSTFSSRDALKLRMNAHLAVLSGCESGRFNVEDGDELIGVASSLLSSGIRSIVATSWLIPDSVTPILIDEFYTGLLDENIGIASALRAAQHKVFSDKRYSHPFYWASFRLLGDWRNNLTGDRTESS
jgi:CHAT domain-containing protein/tetratricopeptide (TPR) repeat protein